MRAIASTYTPQERRDIAADDTDKADARHQALNSEADINLASDSPAGRVEVADQA